MISTAPIHEPGTVAMCRRTAAAATVVILIGSALLLFTRLGHYPLWDDEAITAMTARGVWRTGDTSARVDERNVLAYRNGLLIRDFKDRFTPPLQFYLLAPFVGMFGESEFICRLPFAVCGLVTVGILLRWMWRHRPPPLVWWMAAMIILTNVEFFLFFRQCRYYSLAMMLTTAVGYLYFHWDGRGGSTVALSLALVALLSSQYLNYAGAVACLILDYLFWGMKRRRFGLADWAVLLLPQLIVGAVVCSIWNPVARGAGTYGSGHWLHDRIQLLGWNWRDMLASDFVIPLLVLACPLLYFVRRNTALLRMPLALAAYVFVISLLVATPIHTGSAEVRYLAPVLPMGIGVAVLAIWGMDRCKPGIKVLVIALAMASMLLQPGSSGSGSPLSSTPFLFVRELVHPQQEPYTPVMQWLAAHVKPGQSVFVRPDWMVYPLMFREGQVVYAWQLTDPPKPEYRGLPDIHFQGRVAPDYMIAFGPGQEDIRNAQAILAAAGARYRLVETLHVFWKDRYRAERLWRSFSTVEPKEGEEIYFYQHEGM